MTWTLLLTLAISIASAQTRVAVIDTGLNLSDYRFKSILCKSGHYDSTGTGIKDRNSHGTHVVGLIKKYAKDADYCIIVIKFYNYDESYAESMENLKKCYKAAIRAKADVVNLSLSGPESDPLEEDIIKNNPKVKFITAAGNSGLDLDYFPMYPASYGYKNIIVVGNKNKDGTRHESSNYGKVVTDWEDGVDVESSCLFSKFNDCRKTGTSMSCAIKTGKYVKEIDND